MTGRQLLLLLQLLITDLAANSRVIEEINQLANEMVQSGHGESRLVRQRQKEINDRLDYNPFLMNHTTSSEIYAWDQHAFS